eukprot:TRINITY_DN27399_c0_g1_i1.p1 TRINITY_DN27399_c0_g1~~TRINITY_DN27399_c0_g1_i1.p1  ORF type:complete len:291 (+),score=39.30 TRINITY_DN27399_c0_g1_i1:163-1035(+)
MSRRKPLQERVARKPLQEGRHHSSILGARGRAPDNVNAGSCGIVKGGHLKKRQCLRRGGDVTVGAAATQKKVADIVALAISLADKAHAIPDLRSDAADTFMAVDSALNEARDVDCGPGGASHVAEGAGSHAAAGGEPPAVCGGPLVNAGKVSLALGGAMDVAPRKTQASRVVQESVVPALVEHRPTSSPPSATPAAAPVPVRPNGSSALSTTDAVVAAAVRAYDPAFCLPAHAVAGCDRGELELSAAEVASVTERLRFFGVTLAPMSAAGSVGFGGGRKRLRIRMAAQTN